jgi:hypothetical protein
MLLVAANRTFFHRDGALIGTDILPGLHVVFEHGELVFPIAVEIRQPSLKLRKRLGVKAEYRTHR